mmetsp:Transcript_15724/g.31283  ORF Transcript_15724/g.31283 Transcript_15724/m.31283 type:complete len:254 (+) Transcript_15724:300-1061(+)
MALSLLFPAFFCLCTSLLAASSSCLRLLKSSEWSLLPELRSALTSFSIAWSWMVNFSLAPVSFLSYDSTSLRSTCTSSSASFALRSEASLSISAPRSSIFISSTSFVARDPALASAASFWAFSRASICFFLSIWAASILFLRALTASTSFVLSASRSSHFLLAVAKLSSSLDFCKSSSPTTFLSSSLWVASEACEASLVALRAKSLVFSACSSFSLSDESSACISSLSFITLLSSFMRSPFSSFLSASAASVS